MLMLSLVAYRYLFYFFTVLFGLVPQAEPRRGPGGAQADPGGGRRSSLLEGGFSSFGRMFR